MLIYEINNKTANYLFFLENIAICLKILFVNETEKPFPYRRGIIQLMHNT